MITSFDLHVGGLLDDRGYRGEGGGELSPKSSLFYPVELRRVSSQLNGLIASYSARAVV